MIRFFEGDCIVDNIKIHYYRTGENKPPVILLHGATDSGICWSHTAENLARDFDLIMLDAQGHGFSDKFKSEFTFDYYASQTIKLIKLLGVTDPIIIGHSMGAGTAIDIAIQQTDLPKALILEDPGWWTPDSTAENNNTSKKLREIVIRNLIELGKGPLDDLIAECRSANPTWIEEEVIPWAQSKLQFDPALFTFIPQDHVTNVELVREIDCPTLLIISDRGIVSAETAMYASEIWKSQKPFNWVQIPGAGHNIHREQFNKYIEVVKNFLKDI